jgi:sugar phosphate isomerase/epimerase
MKIGFLTACLPQVDLQSCAAWASQNGFGALELAAWPTQSERDYQARQINAAWLAGDEAKEISDFFAQYHMQISAMAYYDNNLHPDVEQRRAIHEHLKKVIDAAELLQVKLVGTFMGGRPDLTPKENIKEFAIVFGDILKYAADRGVKMMIENCPMENWVRFGLPGNYAYSPELWQALFNELPDDNLGLNLDPSHLYWLGIDYVKVVKEFAAKIFHVHAKDTEILKEGQQCFGILNRQVDPIPWKSGWWRYRIPGLGEIQWKNFITALQENGYDQVLSIEHEDPIWEGSEEKVKQGLVIGRKHLSQFVE